MKKIVLVITVLVFGFFSKYAVAQTGMFPPLTTFHYHTDCAADSTTWFYNDELEEYDFSKTMLDATVFAQVMPGSWLYETTIVASFHFEQNYSGPISIFRSYVGEHISNYDLNKTDADIYTKNVIDMQPGSQVTWQLGQYFDTSGVWDGSAGEFRSMVAEVQMASEGIAGYLTIDVIRIKQFDGGAYCYAN